MTKIIETDIAIIGGGIAGLWLLNAFLHQTDFHTILLEHQALGQGQTIHSQGIIHGGLKYTLQGNLNAHANAVEKMPSIWRACLQGQGNVDLTKTTCLAEHQHLWSPGSLAANIGSFFASKALQGRIQLLNKSQYPIVFQHNNFKGKIYQLSEVILDIYSLLNNLAHNTQNYLLKTDVYDHQLKFDESHNVQQLTTKINGEPYYIKAQYYIFTAGFNNQALTFSLPQAPEMQTRPLHQVYLWSPQLPPLYAHCIGASFSPRITITTHYTQDNIPVWYLGGKLAEDGVHLSKPQQLQAARQELKKLFPWLNFDSIAFDSFLIDRAEARTAALGKPNDATIFPIKNCIIAWPTKLALAPSLTEKILAYIQSQRELPKRIATTVLDALPKPVVAKPIWINL